MRSGTPGTDGSELLAFAGLAVPAPPFSQRVGGLPKLAGKAKPCYRPAPSSTVRYVIFRRAN